MGSDVDGVDRDRLGKGGGGGGEFDCPTALALVPGLGLVVRDIASGGLVQVFATPDAIAMASMSVPRVAWMVAVTRGPVVESSWSTAGSMRVTLLLASADPAGAREVLVRT